jgi:hypothetical protein
LLPPIGQNVICLTNDIDIVFAVRV